jgi:hypothetical protein
VDPLCSKLHYLIRDNVTNDLTSDEIAILINELESRMHKLFEHRKSQGLSNKHCLFMQIDLTRSGGIVLDLKSPSLENEITSLLDRLIISKPECFKLVDLNVNFPATPVNILISKLK